MHQSHGIELHRALALPLADTENAVFDTVGHAKHVAVVLPFGRHAGIVAIGKAGPGNDASAAAGGLPGPHLEAVESTGLESRRLTLPFVQTAARAGDFKDLAIDPTPVAAGESPSGRLVGSLVEMGIGSEVLRGRRNTRLSDECGDHCGNRR